MRFLLDQGLPRSAAHLLRDHNVEAIHVGDLGLASASDAKILEFGLLEHLVVVTLDADFHALLALSGASKPSVIRIRIEGLRADAYAPDCTGAVRLSCRFSTRIHGHGDRTGNQSAPVAAAALNLDWQVEKECTRSQDYARARPAWRASRRKSGAWTSTVRHIS